MHPRERLFGMAKLLQLRGQPLPLTLLAEAERLGLSLQLFDEPTNTNEDNANLHEGEISYGPKDYI